MVSLPMQSSTVLEENTDWEVLLTAELITFTSLAQYYHNDQLSTLCQLYGHIFN